MTIVLPIRIRTPPKMMMTERGERTGETGEDGRPREKQLSVIIFTLETEKKREKYQGLVIIWWKFEGLNNIGGNFLIFEMFRWF